jgi:hypothetical protein
MSRVEFLMNLARYRVFPFEAELRDLEARNRKIEGSLIHV